MSVMRFTGSLETKIYWLIPIIIGFGVSKINDLRKIYSLQITPFINISFCYRGTLSGSKFEDDER